jgi:hypothetical protein
MRQKMVVVIPKYYYSLLALFLVSSCAKRIENAITTTINYPTQTISNTCIPTITMEHNSPTMTPCSIQNYSPKVSGNI